MGAYLATDGVEQREKSGLLPFPIRRTVTSALGGGVRSKSWSTTLTNSASEPQLRNRATSSMEALPRSAGGSSSAASASSARREQQQGSGQSVQPPAWSYTVWANGIAKKKP